MSIQLTLPDLAARINAEHDACMALAWDAVTRAIEVGRLLTEAKGQLGHGEWIPWVEANCRFNVRQSQKYMRAYAERDRLLGPNANPGAHLTSLNGAMGLLAEPKAEDRSPLSEAELAELARLESIIQAAEDRRRAAGLTPEDEWLLCLEDLVPMLEDPRVTLNEEAMVSLRNLIHSMTEEMTDLDWPPGETIEAKLAYARRIVGYAGRIQNAATEHKLRIDRELGKLLAGRPTAPRDLDKDVL